MENIATYSIGPLEDMTVNDSYNGTDACHDIAKNIAESGVKHNKSNQILRTKLQ
jgi:hypothetical protein